MLELDSHKEGVSLAQVSEDSAECRQKATRATLLSIPSLAERDSVTVPEKEFSRRAFNRCLSERGDSLEPW